MNAYTYFPSHWKVVIVAAFLAILPLLVGFYYHKATVYKADLAAARVEIAAKSSELDNLAEIHKAQESRIAVAEQRVLEIAAEQQTKIVTIKQQAIPKESAAAIDFAIENKGDLAW